VEYKETADKAERAVVDGENLPDITFEEADPPIGGLRTWPQIRQNPTNKPKHIRKLTNLKACIKKTQAHQQNHSHKGRIWKTPTSGKRHKNRL
jgi:hypothetical protein